MEMGDRIKERRLAMGYTQDELSVLLGLQRSAIAKYENGRVENLKRSIIAKMSEILECSPAYLMGWEEQNQTTTLVAHFDGTEYTEEELKKIKEFAAFVKATRK